MQKLSNSQKRPWMPLVGDEFEIPHINGRLVVGEGKSPMEFIVDHCGVGFSKMVSLNGGWSGVDRGLESDQNFNFDSKAIDWLEADHLHEKGQLNAVVLATAGAQDSMFSEYIDDLKRHCWKWLLEEPNLNSMDAKDFLISRMESYFGSWLSRVESDMITMKDVLDSSINDSGGFEVDVKCISENIFDNSEFMDDFMKESNRRNVARSIDLLLEFLPTLSNEEQKEQKEFWLEKFGTDDINEVIKFIHPDCDLPTNLTFDKKSKNKVDNLALAKKRISKAYKLFDSLGLEKIAKQFTSGYEVCIPCSTGLKLKVSLINGSGFGVIAKSNNLNHFCAPFNINVESQDGANLGSLCAYIKETPILDTLLAIILHAQSGNEKDFIDKANWYGINNIELTKNEIFRIYGSHLGNLGSFIPLPVIDSEFCRGSYKAEPFNLAEWISMIEINSMEDSWVWSDAKSSITPVKKLHPGESLNSAFIFTREIADGPAKEVDKAIAQWLGRAIKRWATIRPGMEKLYVEHRLPETPCGWVDGNARVFCGVNSLTAGWV